MNPSDPSAENEVPTPITSDEPERLLVQNPWLTLARRLSCVIRSIFSAGLLLYAINRLSVDPNFP